MRLPRNREGRRLGTIGLSVIVIGLIALTASAAHSFTDVSDEHTFHNDIEWMKDSGITKGCNPPTNDEYCPDDFTTRGQMAAFFHRFALAGVVDADTVDGLHAEDLLAAGDTAANSDKLDGKDADDFLGKDEKAADSDLLDGKDSTEFVQVGDDLGGALAASTYVATATETFLLAVNNTVTASCDAGDVLLGGGYDGDALLDLNIFENRPNGSDWVVTGTVGLVGDVTAYAICVSS